MGVSFSSRGMARTSEEPGEQLNEPNRARNVRSAKRSRKSPALDVLARVYAISAAGSFTIDYNVRGTTLDRFGSFGRGRAPEGHFGFDPICNFGTPAFSDNGAEASETAGAE
jgi:hypothetical protein